MKTLLIIAALSGGAETYDQCKDLHNVSRDIMHARQVGVKVTDAIDAAERSGAEFLTKLIVLAYQKPRFSTNAMKERAITEFANSVYLECKKQEDEEL